MNSTKKQTGLNIGLWLAQVLLAAMFIMAGVMKSTQSLEELSKTLPWVDESIVLLVRFIGISELLAGLGLLLPSLLRIKPILTPIAALGLVVIMILAFMYHFVKGEYDALLFNVVLGALAGFIAWGRFKKLPIPSKK